MGPNRLPLPPSVRLIVVRNVPTPGDAQMSEQKWGLTAGVGNLRFDKIGGGIFLHRDRVYVDAFRYGIEKERSRRS
jgi:hypothetical protein